ncbi:FtsL-like putative cell division protein [Labilibaculum sp. K2S]|uniref:FtsL-like putative cell division protein n=1 Tax=Labilibaculum sp. K2S TaxID=3056386 RepID=UPI0025A3A219|nr:FtsL-like putative cell division protein [Labilibaculum sp. K2S]MDM8161022.1 FtsL-like putative cell division protein [Labilibaculum sp. K2S]
MFKFRKKYNDFIKPSEELKETSSGSVKDFIDGSILTKTEVVQQLPFIIFLVVLGIFYISNRYRSERVYRDMVSLEQELKELRFESITTASDLMYMSKQSEVVKRVENEGLELIEATEPPIKIYLEK